MNFAVNKIKTKYFLQISPDLEFNFEDLNIFLDFAEKKENKFAALGPRFLEVNKKSHKQINEKLEFGEIDSIHGSCMFIYNDTFLKIGKFDENFFLYLEEIDLCKRLVKKGYSIYVTKTAKIKHLAAQSSNLGFEFEKCRNWHWMWSSFSFYKKYI